MFYFIQIFSYLIILQSLSYHLILLNDHDEFFTFHFFQFDINFQEYKYLF